MAQSELPKSAVGGSYAGALSFLRCPFTRDLRGVDVAVLGVPYDLATTNRPGARFGPRALREQSAFVGEYPWGVWPWEFDVRQRFSVIDYGDVDFNVGYPERMVEEVEQTAGRILESGASLLGLGGDHFVSYPLLRAHAAKFGPLALVHFDAHSDSWASDDYNHGTMFYHAAQEGVIDAAHSVQVGIRTPNPDTHGFTIVDARWLLERGVRAAAERIREVIGGRRAYLTLDIDFLDPAYAPGTGTPVVGGPTTYQARELLQQLRGLNVVGGDQVEVAPAYDAPGQITALAGATLATDILYLISLSRAGRGAHA
ncbi:MAG: agmatinase [Proteobacteria bacterium]|nr:MAG: agmatinase [Pseudomonadota bacterium]